MTTFVVDSRELRRRLHQATLRSATLHGVRKADTDARDRLVTEVSEAKGRLSLGEEVARIFDALQQRAHERSVGAFERLLSAILRDVLPEEGAVRLLPQFKNNTTWLDVALEKGGKLEDLIDGNGGAVTNVVCTGLRFAALSRTQNRRLMILDEPDCWLKPERVPSFVRVIAQVSAQTHTQTFFITHHDPSYFEGQVNVVRFAADENGKIFAQALAPVLHQWENDDQPGLRGIELINFRRHEHTVIPCFPGPTAFIGDNNFGKSTAINTSFKALAYGESDESMIRHDCDQFRIVFHIEQKRRIEMTRARKGSPAVMYRLYEEGNPEPLIEGPQKARGQAPEWVTNLLGVQRVDDLDIQLGNQKSPVFLLNETASKRAQILSVGREAGYLKTLMKRYDELKSSDRETVKHGEAKVAKLAYRLKQLEVIERADEKMAELVIDGEDLFIALERREQLEQVMGRVERALQAVGALEQENAALQGLPEQAPQLVDTAALERVIGVIDVASQRLLAPAPPAVPGVPQLSDLSILERVANAIELSSRRLAVPALPELPEVPPMTDTAAIVTIGQRLGTLSRTIATLEQVPTDLPESPALADGSALAAMLERLVRQTTCATLAMAEVKGVDTEHAQAEAEHEQLKEELGGLCPLCGSHFPEQHDSNGAAHVHTH
jgi:energy-coupling factor transporter ATP-binding protein EcfA2